MECPYEQAFAAPWEELDLGGRTGSVRVPALAQVLAHVP